MLRGPIYCLAEGQGIVEFEISIRERYRKVVELYFKKNNFLFSRFYEEQGGTNTQRINVTLCPRASVFIIYFSLLFLNNSSPLHHHFNIPQLTNIFTRIAFDHY